MFAHDILETTDINLAATMVSDPLPSPVYERTQMHVLPAAHGILDVRGLEQVGLLEQKCWADFTDDIAQGSKTCSSIMSYINEVSAGVAWFDSRIFMSEFTPLETQIITLLNTDEMVEALHLQNSTKSPRFEFSSSKVKSAFQMSHLVDYSIYYRYLIERNHPLIVMVGQFDM
jgi:hypothetical protein